MKTEFKIQTFEIQGSNAELTDVIYMSAFRICS